MAKRQKVKRFSVQSYDAAHYRQTEQYTQAVDALFDRATNEIVRAAAKGQYDPDKPFSFDDYPSVKAVMQSVTKQLASRITTVIESGSKKQWLFACSKNDGFISSIFETSKLSKARLKKMQDQNLDALKTFQGRKVEGMNLSQRVWKYVGQYREQLESAIDAGLGEGRSAAQLSRDVRQNLRDPNRLFRRVRDKRGNLVLSKAARAFHPGRGVYRSSAKNAARLTRSEINMAYRESDYLRWQSLDFVVGFEVKRSNHEPLCDCDICEKLKGRYPKHFKFKGWHPQCMCYAVPILMDEETFDENELGDLKAALRGTQYKRLEAKNVVVDVPDGFKEWVKEHEEAQANWSSTPYFIKDNFKDGKLSKGLNFDTKKQIYAIGFAIYGLSEYARATGDAEALDYACRLFEVIEKYSFDAEKNGYLEALTRDWRPIEDMRLSDKDENEKKTMNTHLHILEPYTNLYRVWKDERLKKQIVNLVNLFLEKILDAKTYHLNLFFEDDWTNKYQIVSYGHDIEASWLIHEAALVVGDLDLLKKVEPVIVKIAEAADEGLNPDGSMIYENFVSKGKIDRELHWWVQAENVVGHVNLFQHFGDEEALQIALRCWNFIQTKLVDKVHGEWHWSLYADGTVNMKDDKAGFWKCPYHNGRMCMEILERFS